MQTIAQGSPYTLKSYGGGACYLLIDETASRAILAQGEDALALETDWNGIRDSLPDSPWRDTLALLWDLWSDAAAPIR